MASPYPELRNRAWLYQRYVLDERPGRENADELGCTHRAVTMAITHFGRQRRKSGRRPSPQPVLQSKRRLAALYAELGSMTRVAQHLHCRESPVREAIERFGIPRRSYVRYDDRAWFVNALRRGLTVRAMAIVLGSQRWSIYRALERHGLPRRGGVGAGAPFADGGPPSEVAGDRLA